MAMLRSLVVTIALGLFLLWFGFLWRDGEGLTLGSYVVGAFMIGLAALAGWGSFRSRPGLVVVAGLLSFVPLGLYLLGTPSVFRWIGVLDLGLLFAGVAWLILERRTTPRFRHHPGRNPS
jgi:hypothetical protein